jgi:hypothetical protein
MKTLILSSLLMVFGAGLSTVLVDEPIKEAAPKTSLTIDLDDESMINCRIQLKRLVCRETEGVLTPDAIYMKISTDGETPFEWPSQRISMSVGSQRSFTNQDALTISQSLQIELWDDDTWDRDDHLGTDRATCNDSGFGEKFMNFDLDGASYQLYYEVL